MKDSELNIRNYLAIGKIEEKSIYFLHILPLEKKKKAVLYLCGYAKIEQQVQI